MTDYIQVITTTERKEHAEQLARLLVENRLAACVQVLGPIGSTYHWQGAIQSSQEWQCVAKSRGDLFARIEETIRGIHPYEVPEILAVPITAASQPYLDWLEAELARPT